MDKIINVINSREHRQLSDLFIYEVKQLENFETQVSDFYEFCSSKITNWDKNACSTIQDKDGNYESKFQEMSFTLLGEEEDYQVCIQWCLFWTPNSVEETKIGIWSLYIIKKSQNSQPKFNYWGDGKWTKGINIGIAPVYDDEI